MAEVLLVCRKHGCPRKKKVEYDQRTMPQGTTKIVLLCPWHEVHGDFGSEEYYDHNNKQIHFDANTD